MTTILEYLGMAVIGFAVLSVVCSFALYALFLVNHRRNRKTEALGLSPYDCPRCHTLGVEQRPVVVRANERTGLAVETVYCWNCDRYLLKDFDEQDKVYGGYRA